MSGGSRPKKVQEWTERLKRFEDTSLTVAQFCKAEGVQPQSYYYWKRKLRDGGDGDVTLGSRFKAVQVSSTRLSGSQPTTIQLGSEICIELGDNLLVAELVVNRVLNVAVEAAANSATRLSKGQ